MYWQDSCGNLEDKALDCFHGCEDSSGCNNMDGSPGGGSPEVVKTQSSCSAAPDTRGSAPLWLMVSMLLLLGIVRVVGYSPTTVSPTTMRRRK